MMLVRPYFDLQRFALPGATAPYGLLSRADKDIIDALPDTYLGIRSKAVDSNKADRDALERVIHETYSTRSEAVGSIDVNDKDVTYMDVDGNILGSFTTQDHRVGFNVVSDSIEEFPILVKYDANNVLDAAEVKYIPSITIQPLLSQITAAVFNGDLTGNAGSATVLETSRSINIEDNDGTNQGVAANFNGSENIVIKLPAFIKGSLTGNADTATRAEQDQDGNVITTTYETKENAITGLAISGQTVTYTKGSGTTGTVTTQDKLVQQDNTGDNAAYPLIFRKTTGSSTSTAEVYFNYEITVNPSTKTITANTFAGNLTGNAGSATVLQTGRNISVWDGTNTGIATSFNGSEDIKIKLPTTIAAAITGNADTATKAEKDLSGNVITTTYETKDNAITGLSISGQTVTYTKGSGTTGTVTTQDKLLQQDPSDQNVAYPLLFKTGVTTSTTTATAYFNTGITVNPSTKTITATKFAGTADKSIADGSGNTITSHYAPLNSPALTGTPTAVTAAVGDSSTAIATTAFVTRAIKNLIGTAPEILDTLGEIASAINNDQAVYTTLQNAISGKQPKHDALTSIAGLTTDANKMIYTSSANVYKTTALTEFARSLLDDADAATARGTLSVPSRTGSDASGTWGISISGTAEKATKDSAGNVITDTYVSKGSVVTGLSANGTTITYTLGNGTSKNITTQDTHWTTKLVLGVSTSTSNAAATNGNVYLRLFDGSTARESINIKGTGSVDVTSNASGVLTINGITYSTGTASTAGLTKLYTSTGTATDGTMTQAAINTAYSTKANTVKSISVSNGIMTITKGDDSSSTVPAGGTSDYPVGFQSRKTEMGWGNQTGTVITDWHSTNGGDFGFRENGGAVNVVTDGYFYQNKGNYQCLDTNNYTSYAPTKTGSGASGTWGISVTGSSGQVTKSLIGTNVADLITATMADNDSFRLRVGGTATNAGYVEFATADDAAEPFYFRQYSGAFATLTRTATILDGSGNTSFPGTVTANSFSGNATSATQLANPRTVQTNLGSTAAASFNGTANITPGVTGTLPIANGGTNATTVANARKSLFGDAMTTANGQHLILISDSWTSGGYLPLEQSRALLGTGYAACSTAVGTAAKVVTMAGFALVAGRQVMVNFSGTNTAAAPTLNINSTGAKSMCSRSGVVLTYQALGAGLHHFVYDGTYYREVTPPHCTRYTTCATAATTVAKAVTCDNWVLATGERIMIKFTVTNTAANPTLNVNGSGAKPIYYRGYAVIAGALQANCVYDLVYNGTQFDITGSLLWTE